MGISLSFVESVLKEKETRGVQNFVLHEKLSQVMERLLRVHERAGYKEELRLISSVRSRPAFRSLDEEESLTPKDAASVLKLEPFASIDAREDALSDRPFEIEQPQETEGEILQSNKSQLALRKAAFMIHDVRGKTTPVVFTRDGKVRPATRFEKSMKTTRR
ncbi:hypothetical protein HDU93_005689 [Gonapodya sp. JEL0774]|nr:hypothetical protein HDU93_005689 [Gonapodya sp. JEL0774]